MPIQLFGQRGEFTLAEPTLQLGNQTGMRRSYAEKRSEDVEPELRNYLGPEAWERLKMQIREGFDRAKSQHIFADRNCSEDWNIGYSARLLFRGNVVSIRQSDDTSPR